jgi:hypothetical protein
MAWWSFLAQNFELFARSRNFFVVYTQRAHPDLFEMPFFDLVGWLRKLVMDNALTFYRTIQWRLLPSL